MQVILSKKIMKKISENWSMIHKNPWIWEDGDRDKLYAACKAFLNTLSSSMF